MKSDQIPYKPLIAVWGESSDGTPAKIYWTFDDDVAAVAESRTLAQVAAETAMAATLTVAMPSWAALAERAVDYLGQRAVVYGDADTHADPVTAATVANSGIFSGTASGWRWLAATGADLTPAADAAVTGMSGAGYVSAYQLTLRTASADQARAMTDNSFWMTALRVGNALDARFAGLTARTIAEEAGYAFAWIDKVGRLLGGFRKNGRLAVRLDDAAVVPVQALDPTVVARLTPAGYTWATMPPESGYVWALVDSHRRILCGITTQGEFKAKLAGGVGVSPSEIAPLVSDAVAGLKLFPSTDIACWGDSMTAGAGGGGTTYPGVLATLLPGRTVTNLGVGGQVSMQIAARQGGRQIKLSVTGDAIPASGGVLITARNINPLYNSGGYTGSMAGTLAGVAGVLSSTDAATDAEAVWTFTRNASGSAVACPPDTVFIPDTASQNEAKTIIIWSGRNGAGPNSIVRDDVISMVDRLTPKDKRFLVLSICNGAGETVGTSGYNSIARTNAELARHFGDRYVDVRRYLIDFGLAEAGITPTTQDSADIAGDTLPASLRADNVHLLGPGYTITGNLVARVLRAKGWV